VNAWLITISTMAVLYGILMIIYRSGWIALRQITNVGGNNFHTHVTIIIPARNEAENIVNCLEAVVNQNYPENLMEIIVVDDHSSDNTSKLAASFAEKNVQVIHLSDYIKPGEKIAAYKKRAIETAISHAKGELIVTTDADCIMGKEWIKTIVACYEQKHPVLIASPVAFYNETSFFKFFQSLDFITMQGVTGATIRYKMGTMCNGANLAYSKKAFEEVGGFLGIDCIASGDDMLLMYKMYKAFPENIRFLKNKEAIVYTLPANSLRDFMQQRIRWSSKAGKYDDKRLTIVLAFVYLWNLLFPVLGILGFFNRVYWFWLLVLLIYKTVIELFFLFPVASFFSKKRMLWKFFPSQFLHIPYILFAGWLGVIGTYEWKGRQVK
jgi:cellulose synthase/poly-beta-1,6-N-acetylglucosamine synthase-like glycosyltransferase